MSGEGLPTTSFSWSSDEQDSSRDTEGIKPIATFGIRPPTYDFQCEGIHVRNYSDCQFVPVSSLRDGLEDVLIFTGVDTDYDVPNGSVWTYRSQAYRPEILRGDVGCGIAAFVIEEIDYDRSFLEAVVSVLDEIGVDIGGEPHFLSFNTAHPVSKKGNILFLHSDMNPTHAVPLDYAEASGRAWAARMAREEFGYNVLSRLGLSGGLYKDWMHTKVTCTDSRMIYQKGAINVAETEQEGILVHCISEAIAFYVSFWKDLGGYMQHGIGGRHARTAPPDESKTFRAGKVRGTLRNGTMTPATFHAADPFHEKFILGQLPNGYSAPYVVAEME